MGDNGRNLSFMLSFWNYKTPVYIIKTSQWIPNQLYLGLSYWGVSSTRLAWVLLTKPPISTIQGGAFPGGSDSKKSACNVGDPGLIPGSGRYSGEGNGDPLQYLCLENSKTEEPGSYSLGSQRVGHDWTSNTTTEPGKILKRREEFLKYVCG